MSEQVYRIKPPAWRLLADGALRLITPHGHILVYSWAEKPGVLAEHTDGFDEATDQSEYGTTEAAKAEAEARYYKQVQSWLDPA